MKRIGIVLGLMLVASPVYSIESSVYIDHSKDAQWDGLLKAATKISLKQMPDKSGLVRVCFPEDSECYWKVWFINTDPKDGEVGTRTTLFRIVDDQENTIQRGICVTNKEVDVEHCKLFDSGHKYTKMRDHNNQWKQIDDTN